MTDLDVKTAPALGTVEHNGIRYEIVQIERHESRPNLRRHMNQQGLADEVVLRRVNSRGVIYSGYRNARGRLIGPPTSFGR